MNNRKILLTLSVLFALFGLILTSCEEEDDDVTSTRLVADFGAESALRWNQLFLEVERYAFGYRPGPAPRALSLMGLAAYEACVTGMPNYNSLEARYSGLNLPNVQPDAEYHWPTVVHAVYASMMPKFFYNPQPHNVNFPPAVMAEWAGLESELYNKYQNEVSAEIFERSKAYGAAVGNAMFEWGTTDPYGHNAFKNPFGNYETNQTYNWQDHFDSPGDWEPTNPGPTSPMGPYFGLARLMALKDSEKTSLPPSYYFMQYSENPSSEYYSQALQTYTKNGDTDYYTEWVGEFWSDDLLDLTFSPGARWIAIGNQVIENENANLETALECYAKVGLALNDAAVACWYSKFFWNTQRPDTYIKKFIDPDYKPNLDYEAAGMVGFTPPFPSFPSGHSTMGAAGAEALSSVFGYAYGMTDNCHLGRTEFEGVPRTFGSFYEMAVENAWSRVLLGVHFRMDSDEGVRFGTVIGRKVNALPWKK